MWREAGGADPAGMGLAELEVFLVGSVAAADLGEEGGQQVEIGEILFADVGEVEGQIGIEDVVGEAGVVGRLRGGRGGSV